MSWVRPQSPCPPGRPSGRRTACSSRHWRRHRRTPCLASGTRPKRRIRWARMNRRHTGRDCCHCPIRHRPSCRRTKARSGARPRLAGKQLPTGRLGGMPSIGGGRNIPRQSAIPDDSRYVVPEVPATRHRRFRPPAIGRSANDRSCPDGSPRPRQFGSRRQTWQLTDFPRPWMGRWRSYASSG